MSHGASQTRLPATQNTAPIHEFACLFTYDIKRKNQKRWVDGFLRFHTFNQRVMVYDIPRSYIGETFLKDKTALEDGDELNLDRGVMVQVCEPKGVVQQDRADILDKISRPQQHQTSPARPASGPSIPSPRPSANAPLTQLRPKPLNAILGTPRGPHGRAKLPQKSPYQERHLVQEDDGPSAKRQRISTGEELGETTRLRLNVQEKDYGQLGRRQPMNILEDRRDVPQPQPRLQGNSSPLKGVSGSMMQRSKASSMAPAKAAERKLARPEQELVHSTGNSPPQENNNEQPRPQNKARHANDHPRPDGRNNLMETPNPGSVPAQDIPKNKERSHQPDKPEKPMNKLRVGATKRKALMYHDLLQKRQSAGPVRKVGKRRGDPRLDDPDDSFQFLGSSPNNVQESIIAEPTVPAPIEPPMQNTIVPATPPVTKDAEPPHPARKDPNILDVGFNQTDAIDSEEQHELLPMPELVSNTKAQESSEENEHIAVAAVEIPKAQKKHQARRSTTPTSEEESDGFETLEEVIKFRKAPMVRPKSNERPQTRLLETRRTELKNKTPIQRNQRALPSARLVPLSTMQALQGLDEDVVFESDPEDARKVQNHTSNTKGPARLNLDPNINKTVRIQGQQQPAQTKNANLLQPPEIRAARPPAKAPPLPTRHLLRRTSPLKKSLTESAIGAPRHQRAAPALLRSKSDAAQAPAVRVLPPVPPDKDLDKGPWSKTAFDLFGFMGGETWSMGGAMDKVDGEEESPEMAKRQKELVEQAKKACRGMGDSEKMKIMFDDYDYIDQSTYA